MGLSLTGINGETFELPEYLAVDPNSDVRVRALGSTTGMEFFAGLYGTLVKVVG